MLHIYRREREEVCKNYNDNPNFRCLASSCPLVAHIKCLAHEMLKDDSPRMLVPLEGHCPCCNISVLWGDLVRLKRGCYQQQESNCNDDDWLDNLSQEA